MPSASTLLAFAAASVVIIAIPGPSVLFTIGRALSSGRREALLTVVGNALGILTQICALAVGLGPLIAASATAYTALKVVGAGLPRVARACRRSGTGGRSREAFEAGVPMADAEPARGARRLRRRRDQPQDHRVLRGAAAPVRRAGLGRCSRSWWRSASVFAVLALCMDGTVALVASRARDWFASSPRRMERVGGAGGLMMVGPRHRPAAHRSRRLTSPDPVGDVG